MWAWEGVGCSWPVGKPLVCGLAGDAEGDGDVGPRVVVASSGIVDVLAHNLVREALGEGVRKPDALQAVHAAGVDRVDDGFKDKGVGGLGHGVRVALTAQGRQAQLDTALVRRALAGVAAAAGEG